MKIGLQINSAGGIYSFLVSGIMRIALLIACAIIMSFNTDRPSPPTCLHPEERKLYDLVMKYRKSKRLPSIPLSEKLTRVAQLHARDLSENFDLNNKNCNIHSWSTQGKWKPCCYTNDHQEAACMWDKPKEIAGYASAGYEIAYFHSAAAVPEEALNTWKASPGHNPVIINEGTFKNAKWSAVGIAVYKEYAVIWFGETEDKPPIGDCP